jgi:hypothetical protein
LAHPDHSCGYDLGNNIERDRQLLWFFDRSVDGLISLESVR